MVLLEIGGLWRRGGAGINRVWGEKSPLPPEIASHN